MIQSSMCSCRTVLVTRHGVLLKKKLIFFPRLFSKIYENDEAREEEAKEGEQSAQVEESQGQPCRCPMCTFHKLFQNPQVNPALRSPPPLSYSIPYPLALSLPPSQKIAYEQAYLHRASKGMAYLPVVCQCLPPRPKNGLRPLPYYRPPPHLGTSSMHVKSKLRETDHDPPRPIPAHSKDQLYRTTEEEREAVQFVQVDNPTQPQYVKPMLPCFAPLKEFWDKSVMYPRLGRSKRRKRERLVQLSKSGDTVIKIFGNTSGYRHPKPKLYSVPMEPVRTVEYSMKTNSHSDVRRRPMRKYRRRPIQTFGYHRSLPLNTRMHAPPPESTYIRNTVGSLAISDNPKNVSNITDQVQESNSSPKHTTTLEEYSTKLRSTPSMIAPRINQEYETDTIENTDREAMADNPKIVSNIVDWSNKSDAYSKSNFQNNPDSQETANELPNLSNEPISQPQPDNTENYAKESNDGLKTAQHLQLSHLSHPGYPPTSKEENLQLETVTDYPILFKDKKPPKECVGPKQDLSQVFEIPAPPPETPQAPPCHMLIQPKPEESPPSPSKKKCPPIPLEAPPPMKFTSTARPAMDYISPRQPKVPVLSPVCPLPAESNSEPPRKRKFRSTRSFEEFCRNMQEIKRPRPTCNPPPLLQPTNLVKKTDHKGTVKSLGSVEMCLGQPLSSQCRHQCPPIESKDTGTQQEGPKCEQRGPPCQSQDPPPCTPPPKKPPKNAHPCCPSEPIDPSAIPPNPCCPVHNRGNPGKFRSIAFFIGIPLILFQMFRVYTCGGFEAHHREPGACCPYEFMRRRTKRFPWGDGEKSFFHSESNFLPGECEQMCNNAEPATEESGSKPGVVNAESPPPPPPPPAHVETPPPPPAVEDTNKNQCVNTSRPPPAKVEAPPPTASVTSATDAVGKKSRCKKDSSIAGGGPPAIEEPPKAPESREDDCKKDNKKEEVCENKDSCSFMKNRPRCVPQRKTC